MKSESQLDFGDVLTVVLFLMIASIGIFGWQIYMYLMDGEWTSLSVINALRWLDIEWAFSPTRWLGVHKMLIVIPLAAAPFLAALGVGFAFLR